MFIILNIKFSQLTSWCYCVRTITENLNKISTADVIVLPIPSTTDGTTLFAPFYKEKVSLNLITEEINKNTNHHCTRI